MLGRMKNLVLVGLAIPLLAAFTWGNIQTCSLQEVSQSLCRPSILNTPSYLNFPLARPALIFPTTVSAVESFSNVGNPLSNFIAPEGLSLRRPFGILSLPPSFLEEISQKESKDFILELGDIASLEAKQNFIKALLGFILEQLIPEGTGSFPKEGMTLTFNLEHLNINPITSLVGESVFAFDPNFNLYLDTITVTISSGPIKSFTELDLQEGNLKGNFAIEFKLGTAIVSSITTFEEGQGLTKEILELSTAIGTINLNSRITLASDLQEFQIQATIAGIAFSGTSILAPGGYWQWQSLGFELKF